MRQQWRNRAGAPPQRHLLLGVSDVQMATVSSPTHVRHAERRSPGFEPSHDHPGRRQTAPAAPLPHGAPEPYHVVLIRASANIPVRCCAGLAGEARASDSTRVAADTTCHDSQACLVGPSNVAITAWTEVGAGADGRDAAIADALDEAARGLLRLATRLRAPEAAPAGADRAAAPPGLPAVPSRRAGRGLGDRQMAVLGLGGLDTTAGLAASEVASALGYTPPNATNILKRLADLGYLEPVRGERPARWRRQRTAPANIVRDRSVAGSHR